MRYLNPPNFNIIMKDRFVVKSSKLESLGCFATENIRRGEIICLMKGEKITFQELKKKVCSWQRKDM